MAKDMRKIHSGVVFGAETITDTDELEQKATPEQLAYLTEQGAIEGFDVPEPKATKKEASKEAAKK